MCVCSSRCHTISLSVRFGAGTRCRYAHVEAKTDSGPNMRKIEERLGLTSARYKRMECFRRIRPEKLAAELRAGRVEDILILDLREKEEFESFRIRVSFLFLVQVRALHDSASQEPFVYLCGIFSARVAMAYQSEAVR
jgi:hypothetical protein